MPTLHGTPLSPYARKVRIALGEKNVAYEIDPVIHLALPDGFEKLHPLRKIPVWTTDDGEHIPDSSVIIAYLDKIHPEPRLLPDDPILLARALFLEEFADSALTMAIATIFLERFAKPLVMNQPSDQAIIDKALTKTLPPLLAHLDATLGTRAFMVGDTFTVADVAIASPLVNFRHTGYTIDATAYPNVHRYAEQMITRPSVAALFTEEIRDYGGDSAEAKAAKQTA